MKMGIRPLHHSLQGPMELAKRYIARDQNAPPDDRPGAQQRDFDGIHFHSGVRFVSSNCIPCQELGEGMNQFHLVLS